jgi:hypothetical protein
MIKQAFKLLQQLFVEQSNFITKQLYNKAAATASVDAGSTGSATTTAA